MNKIKDIDENKAELIARIKRYKQYKRIERFKRQTKINLMVAKFLTFASIPALTACPSTEIDGKNTLSLSSMAYDSQNPVTNMAEKGSFDITTAAKLVAEMDGEVFLKNLNAEHTAITSRPAGKLRNTYIKETFGDINYCNMAVIKALKSSQTDYLENYLENLSNPALCEAFVTYVKKTNPDCIRSVSNMQTADLKRGDIIVLRVKRKNSYAQTSTGRHTVTYDGKEFISFNSTKKYPVTADSGDIIDMEKLRRAELNKKLETMSQTAAMTYLMHLSNRAFEKLTNKEECKSTRPFLVFNDKARTF